MQSIENNICQAIDIIVDKAIQDASYDKTILAQVLSCVDATIGKYKVKYQDNVCYAYSGNTNITYVAGTDVYILVPGGNLDKEKTIIGTTKKLGINYVSVVEGDEAYEYLGSNCITSNDSFQLSSYKPEEIILYSNTENKIALDKQSVNEYIKNSSTIICGARFRTALEMEQRFQGNYGIKFVLCFIDNATQQEVLREYIIDVNKMVGNPYKFIQETRQYGIFEIDGANFERVESISIFVKDFPHTKEEAPYDIFIRDLELYSAARLKESDLNSYSVSILTPQGTFFDTNSLDSDRRTLQAQVKVKGKVVDKDSQTLEYYWFVEHNGVTLDSPYYCKHGGQGWKCLNEFNILKGNNDDPDVVEWIPGDYEWVVTKQDIIAKEVKYKCVVVYNNTVISKTVIIKNLSSTYDISIASDSGTKFYYDIGHPILTCLVKGKEEPEFTYVWAVENNIGQFNTLEETIDKNTEFNNAVARLKALQSEIKSAGMQTSAQTAELESLNEYLTNAKKYCRIEGNKIHYLQISSIVNFSTYKCSVYNKGIFLGTASIVITNSLEGEGAYTLVINNGTQVFKYNENGVSPASSAVDKPIKIKALTFTIYDNLGNPIDDDVTEHCDIRWIAPTDDTLLTFPSNQTSATNDPENKTETFVDCMTLAYGLENRYDVAKTRNNIRLEVDYKDMHLVTHTNFTFVKEGEPGTNGTEYVCKIVPNYTSESQGIFPMVINKKISYQTRSANKWFIAELWENGERIYDGIEENSDFKVSWKILQNKYKSDIIDPSHLTVEDGHFECLDYKAGEHVADIIQASIEYNGKIYYATYPLIVEKAEAGYKAYVRENTGFKFAVYTSDGQRPQYDDSFPFEIVVLKEENGVWEEVSLSTKENLTYTFELRGQTYKNVYDEKEKKVIKQWIDDIYLKQYKDNELLKKNQLKLKPQDPYDGHCVTNGFECIIKKDNNEIIRLHYPIHLMINRFGLSHLNGWDGNSIQIDNEQGFILSPQVGAGVKDKENGFTGVLMGKVDDAKENNDAVGLIGYSKGRRSIFLDAETGKAEFGTSTSSKIVIEPGDYNTETGAPNFKAEIRSGNYNDSSRDGAGLLIDFAIPMMKFGTGNFEVSPQGHITAKGGGTIAGWNIANKELYQDKVGMSSNNKNDDGTSNDTKIAFWSGSQPEKKDEAPFRVDFDGNLYTNKIKADGGTVGGWKIDKNFLKANNITISSSGSIKHEEGNESKWGINNSGSAYFKDVTISDSSSFSSSIIVDWKNGTGPFGGTCKDHIKNISANYIKTTYLDAMEANIGKLDAKIVTVTGTLSAVEAKIDTLTAKAITTDSLVINKGSLTIGSFKAFPASAFVGGMTLNYLTWIKGENPS